MHFITFAFHEVYLFALSFRYVLELGLRCNIKSLSILFLRVGENRSQSEILILMRNIWEDSAEEIVQEVNKFSKTYFISLWADITLANTHTDVNVPTPRSAASRCLP